MSTRTHVLRATVAAVAVTCAWIVVGPGDGGAVERPTTCDAVNGEIRCLCPGGGSVTLGPVRDGEGTEIIYPPDAGDVACAGAETTTTLATTSTTTPDPSTTTTTTPPATPGSETTTPSTGAGVLGATAGRSGGSAGARLSFTG